MEGKMLEKVQEENDLGVIVHKADIQVAETVKKANRALAQIRRTTSNKEPDTVISIYKATVRPHLEYCIQALDPYLKKDINALEQVQHRVTNYDHFIEKPARAGRRGDQRRAGKRTL